MNTEPLPDTQNVEQVQDESLVSENIYVGMKSKDRKGKDVAT